MALLAYLFEPTTGVDDDVEIATIISTPVPMISQGDWGLASAIEMFDATLEDIIDREANPENMVLLGEGSAGGGGINESIPEQFIRGRVVDIEGDGCARVVIAVDRATGTRLAITTSDPTGNFTLRPRTLDACILIAVPLGDEQLNAVVLDNILPVPS